MPGTTAWGRRELGHIRLMPTSRGKRDWCLPAFQPASQHLLPGSQLSSVVIFLSREAVASQLYQGPCLLPPLTQSIAYAQQGTTLEESFFLASC